MRNMLIEEIKILSKEVDNDDLDWYPWERSSNKELLDMFAELVTTQRFMEIGED